MGVAQCIAQWVSLAASRGLGQRSIARMGETKRTEAKPLRQPRRGRTAKAHKAAEKKGTLLFARFPPAWLTRTQDKARIECEKKKEKKRKNPALIPPLKKKKKKKKK